MIVGRSAHRKAMVARDVAFVAVWASSTSWATSCAWKGHIGVYGVVGRSPALPAHPRRGLEGASGVVAAPHLWRRRPSAQVRGRWLLRSRMSCACVALAAAMPRSLALAIGALIAWRSCGTTPGRGHPVAAATTVTTGLGAERCETPWRLRASGDVCPQSRANTMRARAGRCCRPPRSQWASCLR